MPEIPDNPKIIVDEDWKSQVETEREAARSGKTIVHRPAAASNRGF